jgi:chemotaxis protein methyltransferase CheR
MGIQINMSQEFDISNEAFEDILLMLIERYGYDFSHYSKASLLRRIQRFAHEISVSSAQELKEHLVKNESVFNHFLQELTVNVTELFRDPVFYKDLKEKVFPILASYPTIKIWHAGCSTGEEVFSMCILLHEAGLLSRTKIYATDINPSNLEKAKKGIMKLSHMKDYTNNYHQSGGDADFSNYYTARYEHAIISEAIRSKIVFLHHNLVSDATFNEFQLVSCRNVMIYFDKQLQNRVLELFHESLSPLGFLTLGLKETIQFSTVQDKFNTVSKQHKIYRRID